MGFNPDFQAAGFAGFPPSLPLTVSVLHGSDHGSLYVC